MSVEFVAILLVVISSWMTTPYENLFVFVAIAILVLKFWLIAQPWTTAVPAKADLPLDWRRLVVECGRARVGDEVTICSYRWRWGSRGLRRVPHIRSGRVASVDEEDGVAVVLERSGACSKHRLEDVLVTARVAPFRKVGVG